jgi:Fe-S-cluster-containing hydrogenase component 2
MSAERQELIDVGVDWETVAEVFQEIFDGDPANQRRKSGAEKERDQYEKDLKSFLGKLRRYFEEGEGKFGLHFFRVRYEPGTVVMAKGTSSDYAALHLRGRLRVRQTAFAQKLAGRGCWENPRLRRLESMVLDTSEPPEKANGLRAWLNWVLASFYLTFPGVPVALVDFVRWRLSWLGGASRADRLEDHLRHVLYERLTRTTIHRSDRDLARPTAGIGRDGGLATLTTGDAETAEKVITGRDAAGNILPVFRRFMGITGTLWHQPRSVTLIADNDPLDGNAPCEMLLIKRKALLVLLETEAGKQFLNGKLREFVATSLPEILAGNRLFQDRIVAEDVVDWTKLLELLRGTPTTDKHTNAARQSFSASLVSDFKNWLQGRAATTLKPADETRILSNLNRLLSKPDLLPPALSVQFFPDEIQDEAARLLAEQQTGVADCRSFRLHRLMLETASDGAIRNSPRPWPMFNEEFKEFTAEIAAGHQEICQVHFQPELYEKKVRAKGAKAPEQENYVFMAGEPADAMYFILSGMVRVIRQVPNGETVANNMDSGGHFGERAIDDLDCAAPGSPVLRGSSVKLLCNSWLLRLDRTVLKELEKVPKYSWFVGRLRRERRRVERRDDLFSAGFLLPPREPPPAIADRLVLTRNILLIDMDKCTRCDQCVKGCAVAHDGVPRFHRANPELRFGRWEAAGACLHCLDAPCLETCPVGAITLLDDRAVQIHRTRCIGCEKCSKEEMGGCPYGVIDMYAPTSPFDAPSLAKAKKNVATKCDLCLTDERDPPCVAWCPYDAAQRVDPSKFFPALKGRRTFAEV